MSEQLKYRHELKYLISAAELALLKNRMRHLLPVDSHADSRGMYSIRSLYFDDYNDRCMRENENGTDPREKFRIRIYNHETSRITLECKRKEHGMTHKSSCPLSLEQTIDLMQGKCPPDFPNQAPLLRKLCLQILTRRMRPVVIVEYDRTPFVCKDGNVRITFDTNICSSNDIGSFLAPMLPKRPVLQSGQELLEVKYDSFLPDAVYRTLQLPTLRQSTFSKYYICRKIHR